MTALLEAERLSLRAFIPDDVQRTLANAKRLPPGSFCCTWETQCGS
jgi:hypothetical protein